MYKRFVKDKGEGSIINFLTEIHIRRYMKAILIYYKILLTMKKKLKAL